MTVTQRGYHENLINNWFDTITAAINASDTTISVNNASAFPLVGFFRVEIGTELIICNGRTGNDLSVATRGSEGTTAASHLSGADIKSVITSDSLQRYLLSGGAAAYTRETTFEDSQAWPAPMCRMMEETRASLAASSFTWVNQGSATIADNNGGVVMTIPDEASHNLRGLILTAPSTPYAFTARMRCVVAPGQPLGINSTHAGLWFRHSSTGRLITLSTRNGNRMAMWRWNSPSSFGATIDTVLDYNDLSHLWFRLEDDGTDLKGFFSLDGSNWTQDGSAWWQQSRTAFMSGGPNQLGFYLNSGTNSGSSGAGPAICTAWFDSFNVEQT